MPDEKVINFDNAREANALNQVAIRMVSQPPLYSDRPMNSPEAAIKVMNDFLKDMDRELFCVVNLQSDLKPINMNIISAGALDQSLAHPREIMKSAILSNASQMLLVHNHPSGSVQPSKNDIEVTGRMQEIGTLLGIPVLDHVIVGRGKEYYSFNEKNTMPVAKLKTVTDIDDIKLGKVAEAAVVSEEKKAYKGKNMDDVMKSLEDGISEIFTSERYAQYLKTMSNFHNYSFNNTLLIAMQRPEATMVTGYRKWQSMGRQVKKGEKGITIIAPAPVKMKKQREVQDENGVVKDASGNPVMEEVEVTIPKFRTTTVFDIDQTYGEPIETLAPVELTAAVKDYDLILDALHEISPVPMRFDDIEGGAKGYYHTVDKEIVIQKGMSESQTIKTIIHEQMHARLHDRDLMKEQGIQKDKMTKEVEAESGSFCVCSALGIADTSEYSFAYIAGWSSDKDMKELKSSMDTIRITSGDMIEELSAKVQELQMQRDIRQEKDESISFYVAECMEFPVLGTYKDGLTLDQAIEAYENLPQGRINGIKGIGFDLQDGSEYAGQYPLMTGSTVRREDVELIDHYKESPLVQDAMGKLEQYTASKEKVKTVAAKQDKKESVLQALHDKQDKIKNNQSISNNKQAKRREQSL